MVENFTVHITPFGLDRNTFVYLPDDWQSSGRRYPVVYMFDGHNLFFDSTATYGTCWGLKEYMDAHPQAIIVAPECNHEGNARLEEYSPYDFAWQEYDIKGRGKAYLDWMVQELKPLIDAKYPTLPDRENTAIGGSSMGGLMSLYGVTAHNETFSRGLPVAVGAVQLYRGEGRHQKSKAGSRHAGLYQLGRARGQWPPRAGPVHRQGAGGHEPDDRQGRDGLPLLPAGRQALRGRLAASAGALLYISVRMEVGRGKAKQKEKAPRPAGPGGQTRPNRACAKAAAPHG